jgi:hypothetical protein
MTPQTLHRFWCAWVRYWLPTKSVCDSRAHALGPARNQYGLPVAGEAVNKSGSDLSKSFHTPSKR